MDVTDLRELGEALTASRKQRGLTQREVCEILAISRDQLSNIEQGGWRFAPRVATVMRLLNLYELRMHFSEAPRPDIEQVMRERDALPSGMDT